MRSGLLRSGGRLTGGLCCLFGLLVRDIRFRCGSRERRDLRAALTRRTR